MLSLYTLKSAKDATGYYQQGDYYTQDGAKEYSEWFGKGAEQFDLTGSVDFDVFKNLLEGRLPNGDLMSQTAKGAYHRPGYDLTFSPPKSVSILALVADNKAVLEAHREAVKNVLKEIEDKYAGYRDKKNGVTTIVRSQQLTIATFEHSDSRAGDPNLHTHCVVTNVTQKPDGEWRTLYADEFYKDVLLLGKKYESNLALGLMKRGYELRFTENGHFEVKGVPESLIALHSKRRGQIEQWLEDNQLSGSKAAEKANFMTRAAKVSTDVLERVNRWREELTNVCSLSEIQALETAAQERGPVSPLNPKALAEQAVSAAILHLEEWHNIFTLPDLIKSAKRLSLLAVNEGELLAAVEQKISDKDLLYLENKSLSTVHAKERDGQNIAAMEEGKSAVQKIMPLWIANINSAFKTSHQKEKAALSALLSSPDRQILLTANSKTLLNKTLKDFMSVSKAQGFYPRVLVQSKTSVTTLKNTLNTERVTTIEGFLLAAEKRAEVRGEERHIFDRWARRFQRKEAKEIWIVQMDISSKQLRRLGHFAESLGARIILTELRQPILALETLKKEGIAEIQLSTSKRLLEGLKVQDFLLKNLKALEKKSAIQEIPLFEERLKLAANTYCQTKGALLATLNSEERQPLNHQVRESLKKEGRLTGEAYSLPVLEPLNLSLVEKSKLHLYQPGDIILFNRELANTKITANSYFEVRQVNLSKGLIELHQSDLQVFWDPLKNLNFLRQIEVFKKSQRMLQAGDILIWNRTFKNAEDKTLDRIKEERAVVIGVCSDSASVRLQNNSEVALKSNQMTELHWDYGYAIHLKSDIPSADKIVLSLKSQPLPLKNIRLLNQLFLQAKETKTAIHCVCDSKERLQKAIELVSYSEKIPAEAPYIRKEALENTPLLATEPLFNRLQSAYIQVKQSNQEFLEPPGLCAVISPELRIATDVVDRVILYHAERESVLNFEQLMKDAIKLDSLSVSAENLEQAFDLALKNGWLISVGENEQGQKLVTTKHGLLTEQLCIQKMKEGKNQLVPIFNQDSSEIQTVMHHPRLTKGQKEAVQLILTTSDRMIAVQGIAGAGKTTALKEIKRLCAEQNCPMVLANTGSATNQAKNASGMSTKTIAQFLTRLETRLIRDSEQTKKDFGGNRLFIVDESSLVSAKDLLRLQKVIETLDARLVFIGDFKQQGSIGFGLGLHDLLAYGIDKAVMQENVRLKDKTAFLAMKKAYQGDMAGTLKTLKDSIEEIPDKREALERIASVYTAFSKIEREQLLVITPLNEDRLFLNNAIRETFKKTDLLEKKGLKVNVFLPTDKREVDKSDILSYKTQHVIRFNTNHPRLNVKAGDYADIVQIDITHQRLTLEIPGKKPFYWAPKNLEKVDAIEIYQRAPREFSPNDLVVFKRNHEAQGIFNGDKATILKIKEKEVDFLLSNGKTVQLDLNQSHYQHLDHGYALTTYAAQGRDVQFVIGYGEGAKALPRKTGDLKIGDIIVLPKALQDKDSQEYSKVVKVIGTGETLRLQDRVGKVYDIITAPKDVWSYFPPFTERKAHQLPLSTSQQSFIISITRGDGLLLVVPYLDDFQAILEKHQQLKRSAISYIDTDWKKLNANVNHLVADIQGKAFPEESLRSDIQKPVQTTKPVKAQHSNTRKTSQKEAFINQETLNEKLERDILGYASQWLGAPNQVSSSEARWGRKGSFSLKIQGAQAGCWSNWETGEKGKGLISLYMGLQGCSFKEALQELAKLTGLQSEKSSIKRSSSTKTPQPLSQKATKDIDETKGRIKEALKRYYRALPIEGTLAEKYLREFRGIRGELPSDFRFLKGDKHLNTKKSVPALVAPYRDKDNNIVGIVRIYLNPDGSKYEATFKDAKGEIVKASSKVNLGVSSQGSVKVQNGVSDRILWIAEGIETALSVAKARPHHLVVAILSVGQVPNVPIPSATEQVVICADNDPATSKSKPTILKAVDNFLAQGLKVFIALPPKIPKGKDKYDFNDLLKDQGLSAVQTVLDNKLEIKKSDDLKKENPRLETDLHRLRLEREKESIKIETPNREVDRNAPTIKAPPARTQAIETLLDR
jgi:conjugative relaxase-like TrwC/TraI family protein